MQQGANNEIKGRLNDLEDAYNEHVKDYAGHKQKCEDCREMQDERYEGINKTIVEVKDTMR